MDAKVMIQELAKALATQNSINKKEAAEFVQTFFQVIIRALKQDKYVKIKGLGTFKQIEVESRESMNIHTGERFEIQGHMKISFTPDATLRDTVNKPFAHFDTITLNDNVTDVELDAVDQEFDKQEESVPAETMAVEEVIVSEEIAALDGRISVAQEESSVQEETPVQEAPILEGTSVQEEILAQSKENAVEQVVEERVNQTIEEAAPIEKLPEEPKDSMAPEDNISTVVLSASKVESSQVNEVPVYDLVDNFSKPTPKIETPEKNIAPIKDEGDEKEYSNKHARYYAALTSVLVIAALAAGYLIGYLMESFKQPKEVQILVHDTIYVEKEVPISDSLNIADEPVIHKDVTTPPVKGTATSAVSTSKPIVAKSAEKSTAVKPVSVTKSATKPAVSAKSSTIKSEVSAKPTATTKLKTENYSQYPQLSGGAYWITGTAQTYKVRKGETIRVIAERFFGSRQMELYIEKYNYISNPDHVAEGIILKIPKLQKK